MTRRRVPDWPAVMSLLACLIGALWVAADLYRHSPRCVLALGLGAVLAVLLLAILISDLRRRRG